MNEEIKKLDPQEIWSNFVALNAVPRPSKKEDRVIEFIKKFGEDLGLETKVDQTGNVLIRKPATSGMENRQIVVLQAHLDMVHQKNEDTDFDFENQGILMSREGDWVKARGTTLGADNGLGVATMMAVLQSKDLKHPAIEALFTVDEETGMTGAKNLQSDFLKGSILLNLDTEEDDEIGIGCAGGVDITARASYRETQAETGCGFHLSLKGLKGGHSGMDIHKGLGNSNKLMNRMLFELQREIKSFRISSIDGGGLRNAIPRESKVGFVVEQGEADRTKKLIAEYGSTIKEEFQHVEPDLVFVLKERELPKMLMEPEMQQKLIQLLYSAHNGVYRMSPEIPDLVETSNNIARVLVGEGKIEILCLTRSSVESSKKDLVNSLVSAFDLGGLEVQLSGDYPGWAPNIASPILKVVEQLYKKQNGQPAKVAACHAGLECGIIGDTYPKMDMVSFGPTIRGAHSPDEKASIQSVQKFWKFLKNLLEEIPEK